MNQEEPTENTKCRLGNECSDRYSGCKIHAWTHEHNEAYATFKIIGIAIAVCIVVFIAYEHDWQVNVLPIREDIKNLNCGQLAEYVADKYKQYSYAEHRYGWLCVNEQIKEFQ